MDLGIYWISLFVLLPTVAVVSGHHIILRPFRKGVIEKSPTIERDEEARRFRRTFLQVYLLVMASDWLQGPYMYMLFRTEKDLSESTVAMLYMIAYTSAGSLYRLSSGQVRTESGVLGVLRDTLSCLYLGAV
jgi:MFS transporter, MFS domain-containing protein family, molybdate-anion transporter